MARLYETVADLETREQILRDSRASVERALRVGTSDLDLRESELAEATRAMTDREEKLRAGEAELARRRSELGAVELKREAIEQRERALDERDKRLSEREAAVVQLEHTRPEVVELAFVPGVAYRLQELEPTPLTPDATLQLEDRGYALARIGPSPLPADDRRCAYLMPGFDSDASSAGSS